MLILSCSKSKSKDSGCLPAWRRYTGTGWQSLQKLEREGRITSEQIEENVIVLSARYGLIPAGKRIPYYELVMTSVRAKELREATSMTLRRILEESSDKRLLLVLSKKYLEAVDPDLQGHQCVEVERGKQGLKGSRVKQWAESMAGKAK